MKNLQMCLNGDDDLTISLGGYSTLVFNVFKYCASNKLSINFKKQNYMVIATPKKKFSITRRQKS